MDYCGYLLPHVQIIKGLALRGYKPKAIAEILLQFEGVEASQSAVAYVLKSIKESKKLEDSKRVTTVTQGWQTWTPEMQEAEFQMGYSR